MYDQILYDVSDPLATVTLNRPRQLNAWTQQMAAEVKHAIARAEEMTGDAARSSNGNSAQVGARKILETQGTGGTGAQIGDMSGVQADACAVS